MPVANLYVLKFNIEDVEAAIIASHHLIRHPEFPCSTQVILRGLVGSASNTLSVCAILCGAHAGSVAAFRSVNSLVGSLGTLALGEDFGWMHLLSVTLYIVGAILTADPEEIVATMGSTLLLGIRVAVRLSITCHGIGNAYATCESTNCCASFMAETW